MDFSEILARFESPKRIAAANGCKTTYQAKCPCHNDKLPSLTISEGDNGKIILHCFADCKTEDILSEIGLSYKDLSDRQELTWHKKKAWGISRELGGEWEFKEEYTYRDSDGKYLYSKVRFENIATKDKTIRYYRIDNISDTAVAGKGDNEPVLYRLPELLALKNKAQAVYICEGEKDVETLRKLKQGFGVATTCGGASDWKKHGKEWAKYFKGLSVVIMRDNDNAGLKLAEEIYNDLRYAGAYRIKIVNPSNLDHGDVTDFLTKEDGTAQALKEKCDAVPFNVGRFVEINKQGNDKINAGILAEVFKDNETYIIIRNARDDRDRFLIYDKGVYKELNKPAVQQFITEYIPAPRRTSSLLDNIYKLIFAGADRVFTPNEVNTNERYINFKNGLLDVDDRKLVKHDPSVINTFQYDFDYDETATRKPYFDKFIDDFCRRSDGTINEDNKMILQEYIGFIFSNDFIRNIKKALILWSRCGNTGKSTLIELITYFVGVDKVSAIKLTEMVSDNRFILSTISDSRLITSGDESATTVKDSSMFKSLTGGDGNKIEGKGKEPYTYFYRGCILIACNEMPFFADDHGDQLYNRLLIVPCENHIDDQDKITNFVDKMKQERQAIFNWALEGYYRLRDNNYCFTESESVKAAAEDYRQAKDNVYRFISSYYTITRDYNDTISVKDFQDGYHNWASLDPSIKEVERKNLIPRLEALGISRSMGNAKDRHHINVLRGLKLKNDGFLPIGEAQQKIDLPYID